MTRYGMVIDLGRCLACGACSLACKSENGTPPGVLWSKVMIRETGKFPATRRTALPTQCMHCAKAPCVTVCPTGATTKRADGIVLVDYAKCIGCKLCESACPYGARTFVQAIKPYYEKYGFTPYETLMYAKHKAGVEEKCTFCVDRIAQGKDPACVTTCPAYARTFGDLDDPKSEVAKLVAQGKTYQLLPEQGTNPSIYYLPAKKPTA